MKRTQLLIICIVIIIVMTLPLAGCIDPGTAVVKPTGESPITGAVMTLSIDSETLQPLQMTEVFKKDTPIIYCSVGVGNISEEIPVSAELVLIKSVSGETQIKKRATAIMTDGPRNLSFSWVRPGEAWVAGEYQVIVTADGKEAVTVPFTIE